MSTRLDRPNKFVGGDEEGRAILDYLNKQLTDAEKSNPDQEDEEEEDEEDD